MLDNNVLGKGLFFELIVDAFDIRNLSSFNGVDRGSSFCRYRRNSFLLRERKRTKDYCGEHTRTFSHFVPRRPRVVRSVGSALTS